MPGGEEDEVEEMGDEEEEEEAEDLDLDLDFKTGGRSPAVYHINRSNVSGFLLYAVFR